MNGKNEVTTPRWQIVLACAVVIMLSAVAFVGAFMAFLIVNGQAVAYEKEFTAVEAPLVQQRDATEMAVEAEKVLADSGVVAGEGNIESIYATTPEKLTIVTSYTEDTPNEKVRAVAAAAWGAGLSRVEGVETVEVMVKDADGLNIPMFMLDEDEI